MNQVYQFLAPFHRVGTDGCFHCTAEQSSRFAKDVAGDHNPLHDADGRPFCVPGDLLFALVLMRCGLSRRMIFRFREMVGADEPIHVPATQADWFAVQQADGGTYLDVERGGDLCLEDEVIEPFIREYVAFSGKTFPHYMIPVMREHGVMFRPERPLVIYDSMGFELEHLELGAPRLQRSGASLNVTGKRGEAVMRFDITSDGRNVGSGWKKLLIGGLREYDEARMEAFVEEFYRRKQAYDEATESRRRGESEH